MTARYTVFDSPLFLGFDQLERMMDRMTKAATSGYPPYNIEQIGESRLRITLAVAGFSMEDLSVSTEDRQLVIRGRQNPEAEQARVFLHRGIASRAFQRSFLLSDEIEVDGAHLEKGLLHIDLVRILPDKVVQTIAIRNADSVRHVTSPQKTAKQTLDLESKALPSGGEQ
jgi:HSP20 family molecular chaperone IbpA